MTGYEAFSDSVAFFVDPERYVLEARGSRVERVLSGLLTQTVEGVREGAGRYGFFLDPKGRVVADTRILPPPRTEGEDVAYWLDLPESARAAIDAHLARYVPPIFAEIQPADVRVASLLGPQATAGLAAACDRLGLDVPDHLAAGDGAAEPLAAGPWPLGDGSTGLVVVREPIEVAGLDVYVPRAAAERVGDALAGAAADLGGETADPAAWEVARIERGLPIYGRELSPDRLAQEAGQDERAIRFDKGCYTGQEVVARIHYRGKVNRHLRGLRLDEPASAGAELYRDGRVVAVVTSPAVSPRLGPIALAYVRREVEPGTRLATVEGGDPTATVCTLPFTKT